MSREKILVIGASGQIGVELTLELRKIYGGANVVAADLREENELLKGTGPYVSLDVMKAEDTVSIDLRTKTAFADTMVVTSGRSHRHVGSIADRVLDDLRKAGCRHLKIEGMPNCDWVLIDAGDVIVHVFRPEVRDFYNLEKMWEPGSVGAKRRTAE